MNCDIRDYAIKCKSTGEVATVLNFIKNNDSGFISDPTSEEYYWETVVRDFPYILFAKDYGSWTGARLDYVKKRNKTVLTFSEFKAKFMTEPEWRPTHVDHDNELCVIECSCHETNRHCIRFENGLLSLISIYDVTPIEEPKSFGPYDFFGHMERVRGES